MTFLLVLILLHGPEGHEIYVNPDTVVALRGETGKQLLADQAGCLLLTTDSKFITVREPCADVRKLLAPRAHD
ncbi:MAG TPA: hypothetical protein VHT00_14190 [Stellaceae bacterium]|jgi:hypothetical protein|nr:hypothetical protein [Stellaceae bacterium]